MAAFYDPAANRAAIASEWKRLGWSDLAIAGMLGRASRESSFNMTIRNKDDAGPGLHSKGLFQWNRTRLAGLFNYAKKNGVSWKDPITQARYTDHELKTSEKATATRLSKAKNITEAVNAAMLYTRPKGSVVKRDGKVILTPTKGLHYKETLAEARKFAGIKVEPGKTPLEEMQSKWDPAAVEQNQSNWDQSPGQSDAKIDFAAQAATEEGIINAQAELDKANTELVTPNEGSFNPDLAGAMSSLFPALNSQKKETPKPPSIHELQSLFAPRLSWASL